MASVLLDEICENQKELIKKIDTDSTRIGADILSSSNN